ncbi:MAG: hypothetical protein BWY11_00213 [Firmicutes bacterium ADurb.Bin182]|nr:MAG: hypothetical protein BWY11_00213 [Firmicutes bacterium ADurb.Bin182]
MVVDVTSHFKIQGCDDMVGELNYRHVKSRRLQVFRHFNSYISASDDHGFLRVLSLDEILDPVRVGYVPKRKYPFVIRAFDIRTDGRRAGRQYQIIVVFKICFSELVILDYHSFLLWIYGQYFVLHPDVYIKALVKAFGSLQSQPVSVAYFPAYVIRQSAVGERNILPPLEQYDLMILIKPSEPCRCRRSPGDPSDNNRFHNAAAFLYMFFPLII